MSRGLGRAQLWILSRMEEAERNGSGPVLLVNLIADDEGRTDPVVYQTLYRAARSLERRGLVSLGNAWMSSQHGRRDGRWRTTIGPPGQLTQVDWWRARRRSNR